MTKALIISAGGASAPLLYSINQHRPEYLICFCSPASRGTIVEEVFSAMECHPLDREFIMTPDEQDLEKCVSVLLALLPEVLSYWNLTYDDLIADFTGGTKVMSSSLVLVMSRHIGRFSYVGGSHRDGKGIGKVMDGYEQMLHLKNPWNELAIEALADVSLLFNRCRFLPAAELAEATGRRTPARRSLFDALKLAAEAYALWDGFQYGKALNLLKQAENKLRAMTAETEQVQLRQFQDQVTANLPVLVQLVAEYHVIAKSTPKAGHHAASGFEQKDLLLIRDLLANAVRRAEVENKHDDAVSRLYSAIEKMAKVRLKLGHQIDNSDVRPEQIPGLLRESLQRECANEHTGGKIQLPLHKSFQLLHALGDPLGIAYHARELDLTKILSIRNGSLLAHGFEPVRTETYEMLLNIALGFLGASKDDLPRFPTMRWGESRIG
jgi:CRISPR-associated protein (TIGR02710 family)